MNRLLRLHVACLLPLSLTGLPLLSHSPPPSSPLPACDSLNLLGNFHPEAFTFAVLSASNPPPSAIYTTHSLSSSRFLLRRHFLNETFPGTTSHPSSWHFYFHFLCYFSPYPVLASDLMYIWFSCFILSVSLECKFPWVLGPWWFSVFRVPRATPGMQQATKNTH